MLHLRRLKWKGKFKRATGTLRDQIALLAPPSDGRGQQENNRYSPKPNNAENEEKNEANRYPDYANQQNMHNTVLNLLENDKFQPVWKNQKPAAFTKAAKEFSTLTQGLILHIAAQQAAVTGYAEAKEKEEQELEAICYDIGQNLALWLEENGRNGEAAQIDLTLTDWDRLRDADLVAKAHLLHGILTAALETNAAELEDYDITTTDATQLKKETTDFERIIADPSAAISRRRALTLGLRPKFREVSKLLGKMDRLIIRFRRTPEGKAFAEAWAASRIIRDLGGSAPDSSPPAPEA